MKEDLAEWFNRLYTDLQLTSENFFSQLETGAIICRHANNVTKMGRNLLVEQQAQQLSCLSVDLNTCSSGACSRSSHSSASGSFINQHYDLNQASLANSTNRDGNFLIGSINSHTLECSPNFTNDVDTNLTNSPVITGASSTSSLSEDYARGYAPSPATIITNVDTNDLIDHDGSTTSNVDKPAIREKPTSFASIDSSNFSLLGSNSSFKSMRSYDQQSHMQQPHRSSDINWLKIKTIPYKQDANPGTFFARDNICQFILWCRSLNIIDCLLFETDDLVDRKNEKSFILCLLEVARIGFKVGMPTPLIIQLEQEIDREIENDAKLLKELEDKENRINNNARNAIDQKSRQNNHDCIDCDEPVCSIKDQAETKISGEVSDTCNKILLAASNLSNEGNNIKTTTDNYEGEGGEEGYKAVSDDEDQDTGPKPQVITNDLLSLHERVSRKFYQSCRPTIPLSTYTRYPLLYRVCFPC